MRKSKKQQVKKVAVTPTAVVHCQTLFGSDEQSAVGALCNESGGTLAAAGAYKDVTCPDCERLMSLVLG